MNLQQAVKIRILNICHERNITINGLAMLAGLSQSTVNSLIDGTSKNPKLLTILRLCLGLNINLNDFFDDPIFYELDDE